VLHQKFWLEAWLSAIWLGAWLEAWLSAIWLEACLSPVLFMRLLSALIICKTPMKNASQCAYLDELAEA